MARIWIALAALVSTLGVGRAQENPPAVLYFDPHVGAFEPADPRLAPSFNPLTGAWDELPPATRYDPNTGQWLQDAGPVWYDPKTGKWSFQQ